MNILIAPDSFKGSLTSKEVCDTIASALPEGNSITAIPLSDGGEGFAECMQNLCKGNKLYTKCHNINNQVIDGFIVANGDTAIIDVATASGLLKRKNVMQASSYGTGELIRFAAENGFKRIVLGLGGSGCCDGGMGCLAALGARFYDENQNVIEHPKANDLNYIFGADFRGVVKDIDFTFACDVENEYFGPNGAAYVFAPQKGARKTDVQELDEGLKRLNAFFKKDIRSIKGGGAAGGVCGGLYAIYGGTIKSGFDIISEACRLEEKIKNADLVITGEGKTDRQTLMGKLPYKICKLAQKHSKKCVVISGSIDDVALGDKMISLVDDTVDTDIAIKNAKEILAEKAKLILQ